MNYHSTKESETSTTDSGTYVAEKKNYKKYQETKKVQFQSIQASKESKGERCS